MISDMTARAFATTFGVVQGTAILLAQVTGAAPAFDPLAFISGLAGTGIFGAGAVIVWIISENVKHRRIIELEREKLRHQVDRGKVVE